ncbi:response regulator transcription factor [Thaumasiovibrio subtropicus]|uniref:response regulator transcription factor n=1 Tax=Thaumasiovibrio subtropicus TaxID=1891207 RepID=UPI000B36236F|nr:response regulator transcription factor [Thaumasiovibrio subtropicus]
MKILVVEDDLTTRDFVKKGLEEHDYVVDTAPSGREGLMMATSSDYALVILDRMLPELDGLKVLAAMRAAEIHTPVLILSALDSVEQRVRGLNAGSDDYLTKPFALAELIARVKILVRRNQTSVPITELNVADLSLNYLSHRVYRAGVAINLQPKEFKLLSYMMEHAGEVVSRMMLFEAVWDYHFDPNTNVIDVHIAKLRRKIEANDQSALIHTVRGAGYVLRED